MTPEMARVPSAANDDRRGFDLFDHMRSHAGWWPGARDRLCWHPIADYGAIDGAVEGEPVLVRAGQRWALAWPDGDGWAKFTEGGSYPLDGFAPEQFAIPGVDDVRLLAQE